MTEDDLTPPRAVAVGIPDRMRADMLANLPNVLLVDSLTEAAAVLDLNPRAAIIYGEVAFGAAVSGQPVFLLDDQRGPARVIPRVMLVIDAPPEGLWALEWDDPRKLAVHAGVRLRAGSLVDVSQDGAWAAWSDLLDEVVAEPPAEGVPSTMSGNDEPNGDPA